MHCRVCDSIDLELVIDLGYQPWCNHFLQKDECGKEPFYPLHVIYCHQCHTSQLNYTVKKEIMFGNHTYLSGITSSLSQHFHDVAVAVDRQFFLHQQSKSVLDIGSNDGTQLKHYQTLGYEVLGVEASTQTAKIANDNGVPTLNEFFNLSIIKNIQKKFDIINASGVFFHLEELHSVCEAIQYGLKQNGVFVVQFLYMKNIMDNCAFDQIYHEHLLYYTLETITVLLERHGLMMFDASLASIHGGSIIAYVGHKGQHNKTPQLLELERKEQEAQCNNIQAYYDFAIKIQQMKKNNLEFLEKAKNKGKIIYGFGAPVKGNTMLNYFGVNTDYIDYLVEKNHLRKNLYAPGTHIPIIMEEDITNQPDIYYVLAWNFKKEILQNNQHLLEQNIEFYFPVNPSE